MKPWRLTLTNNLVDAYGLVQFMDTYVTRSASFDEIKEFHREDYLEFLQRYASKKHLSECCCMTRYHTLSHTYICFNAIIC